MGPAIARTSSRASTWRESEEGREVTERVTGGRRPIS